MAPCVNTVVSWRPQEGLGPLHVEVGGLQLWGRSWMEAATNTRELMSRPQTRLQMYGYLNTSIYGLKEDGNPDTAMLLNTRDATIMTNSILVTDADGSHVFSADAHGSSTSAHTFRITGSDGAVFDASAQTPLILARPNHRLDIESSTRTVDLFGNRVMSVQARDGNITATSLNTMTFESDLGELRFRTPSLYMSSLPLHGEDHVFSPPTSEPLAGAAEDKDGPHPPTTQRTETQIPAPLGPEGAATAQQPQPVFKYAKESVQVYQVCVCPSGRVFLAPADATCVHDVVTCR